MTFNSKIVDNHIVKGGNYRFCQDCPSVRTLTKPRVKGYVRVLLVFSSQNSEQGPTNFHEIVINFLGSKLLYITYKVKISNNPNDLSKTLTKPRF